MADEPTTRDHDHPGADHGTSAAGDRPRAVVVTGASSGIGDRAARALARMGAQVTCLGRDPERTAAVARAVGTEPVVADLADLAQVRRAADEVLARTEHVDVLILNAGGMFPKRALTVDGHERTFQVNHLAQFLLAELLRPRLEATAAGNGGDARIVVTSSLAHRFALRPDLDDLDHARRRYVGFGAYAEAKLWNALFAAEHARRHAGTGVHAVAVHPGNVATSFGGGSLFPGLVYRIPFLADRVLIPADAGAAPLVLLASQPDPAPDGAYADRLRVDHGASRATRDPRLAAGLWDRSRRLLDLD